MQKSTFQQNISASQQKWAERKWLFLAIGAAFILIGLIFLIFPTTSGLAICYTTGGILTALGIFRFITYLRLEQDHILYRYDLTQCILLLAAGIWLLIKPELLMTLLPTLFGILMIIDGMIKLQNTIDFLRMHDSRWWLFLVATLVITTLGVLVLTDPFSANDAFLIFVGIGMIVVGVLDIAIVLFLQAKVKQLRKSIEDAKVSASAIETDYTVVDDENK